jgi:hypothetical protein
MERNDLHELPIKKMHGTHIRTAEAYRVGDNRFENRLQIEGGAANGFEHFRGGSLVLLCLIALAGEHCNGDFDICATLCTRASRR